MRALIAAAAVLILGTTAAGATSVHGGSAAQRSLAARILRRLAPSKLVSVRFRVGAEMRIHGVEPPPSPPPCPA